MSEGRLILSVNPKAIQPSLIPIAEKVNLLEGFCISAQLPGMVISKHKLEAWKRPESGILHGLSRFDCTISNDYLGFEGEPSFAD